MRAAVLLRDLQSDADEDTDGRPEVALPIPGHGYDYFVNCSSIEYENLYFRNIAEKFQKSSMDRHRDCRKNYKRLEGQIKNLSKMMEELLRRDKEHSVATKPHVAVHRNEEILGLK